MILSGPSPFPKKLPKGELSFSLWELFLTQAFILSKHTTHLSESDLSSTKTLLKQMDQDLQSLQLRQLQHENQIIKEKKKKEILILQF